MYDEVWADGEHLILVFEATIEVKGLSVALDSTQNVCSAPHRPRHIVWVTIA